MLQAINSYYEWTLSDWLTHLENRYLDEIKLGLTSLKHVAAKLNLLSPQATVIIVAGTNGKGTTVAALESIYQAAGYRVGTYTSPHLLCFNERIKMNGICITDEALCDAFCCIEDARLNKVLTYFEVATLAALLHFQISEVDLIILEVGMGGRLDATNILNPDLSIITTIDFDHQDYLGNTLDQIGFEKAGILRAEKPFIYADNTPPQTIRLCASMLACPSYINGTHYSYQSNESEFIFNYLGMKLQFKKTHWHPNALAAAIMASICLQEKLPIEENVCIQGLKSIVLFGRQQRIDTDFVTLLDVAHNAQSANYLAQTVHQYQVKQHIHAVFSAFFDKDLDALLKPMVGLVDYWYPALLTGKRGLSVEQFNAVFQKYGIMNDTVHYSPWHAYQVACQKAVHGDLIVVYGSFLTVGGVLSGLIKQGLDKSWS